MSIRRDLLMRTALLRMPDVLVAARAATPSAQPLAAPARVAATPPQKRRPTKPRTPAM